MSSEGGQPKTTKKDDIAAESGFTRLLVIADGKCEAVQNVYQIVYDVEVLKASYNKLKSRPASMTPGVDDKNLNSLNITEKYFDDLSNKLRMEQYRPLGIPFIEDRIVQQSLLYLLEAVFEKTFSDRSHGFRPKKTSEPNPIYREAKSLLRSKKGKEKKEGYKQLRKLKSTIQVGMKLYYVSYADDWLIGVWGRREDAVKVKNKIEIFLREKMGLEMSLEKTKITHAGKEKVFFLGYDIYSPTPKESMFEKGKINKVKKRASHVSIYIDAPYYRIKKRLVEEKILEEKNGKWLINAVLHWVNYNHAEILYRYNWIIKGYLNYYSHVNNLYIFHKIINLILVHSCALTLGRKLKLRSRKKVFKKFGKILTDPKSNLTLNIPSNYQSNTKDYRINHKNDPLKILKWSVRTQHLLEGPCVGCGATRNIEIHHVKKLVNIKRDKGGIHRIMATLGRKQVPVCAKCHKDIHTGKYDKKNSPRKNI